MGNTVAPTPVAPDPSSAIKNFEAVINKMPRSDRERARKILGDLADLLHVQMSDDKATVKEMAEERIAAAEAKPQPPAPKPAPVQSPLV